MLKEFREFVSRGNLVELAVAITVGVAFAAMVQSFVFDMIMPVIGSLIGNVDFANLFVVLTGETYPSAKLAREAGAAAIYYGQFINTVVNFLIIAFVMFLIVKGLMKIRKPAPVAAPTTKECPFCKTQIPVGAVRCPHCTSELAGKG